MEQNTIIDILSLHIWTHQTFQSWNRRLSRDLLNVPHFDTALEIGKENVVFRFNEKRGGTWFTEHNKRPSTWMSLSDRTHLSSRVHMSCWMTYRHGTDDLAMIQRVHLPRNTRNVWAQECVGREGHGLCLAIADDERICRLPIRYAWHSGWVSHTTWAFHWGCNLKTWRKMLFWRGMH
jgi:hypothetical protein